MTDDELVERVRKALYFAKHHGGDDAQAEVAIRGIARMLANNLEQFSRVFVPYEPPIEKFDATQAMGQQIIQLTMERGEFLVTIEQLRRQLRDAQSEIRELQRRRPAAIVSPPPPKKQVIAKMRSSHRLILEAVLAGHITEQQILTHTGMGMQNLASRLSDMANDRHFGGALLRRRAMGRTMTFEATEHGMALLDDARRATYQAQDGGHDAGRRNTAATRSSLHSAR